MANEQRIARSRGESFSWARFPGVTRTVVGRSRAGPTFHDLWEPILKDQWEYELHFVHEGASSGLDR
jgi:hypothetical protein